MDMLDDIEFKITKLELGPGDILAVRTRRTLTSVVAAEMTARLERRLGLPGRVLIVDAETDLAVIAKVENKRAAKG
jgi:hypothetical protein